MKTLFAILLLASSAAAANPACCYEALFRGGDVGQTPCGITRGKVLLADGHFPKAKARMQSAVWKGKHFHADGSFTNRWFGFEAIRECMTLGTSCVDGAACFVMEYPEGTPVFGGLRDELRAIGPGVWLGRSTVAATGEFKNYFRLVIR